jgi:hypothetical protein
MLPKVYQNLRAGAYLIRIKKKSPNAYEHTKLIKGGLDKIIITASFSVYFDTKNQEECNSIII